MRALFFLFAFGGVVMSRYEELIEKKELCLEVAHFMSDADDFKLTVFYMNAAEGFRRKAEKLKISDMRKA